MGKGKCDDGPAMDMDDHNTTEGNKSKQQPKKMSANMAKKQREETSKMNTPNLKEEPKETLWGMATRILMIREARANPVIKKYLREKKAEFVDGTLSVYEKWR